MHEEGAPNQLAGALSDQRVSRKRAQEDVKLLANRIALLKQEEQKVSKSPPLLLSIVSYSRVIYNCCVCGVGVEEDRGDQEKGK